jgi:phage protein D
MSASAVPIFTGQDFYVPAFQVKLQGRPAGQEIINDILQVTYKDDIEQVDNFEISINNWDADKLDFKYSDQDLFNPGKKLELWMGYYGADPLRLMIKGQITGLTPNFPSSGQPTLSITGLNLLHQLRKKQESHQYQTVTDSQIAQQVAGRLGIRLRLDPDASSNEQTHDYILQHNQYDIMFLLERARRNGYDLVVEEQGENGQSGESSLYFGPSLNVSRTPYLLTWGKSLVQFQPHLTTANQVGSVTVRAWSTTEKQIIEATATRDSIKTRGVGTSGNEADIQKSFNERQEIISDRPVQNKPEAQTLASQTLERNAKDMVQASGSTVGFPTLRAGTIIFIEKLGRRFSGRYFVTSTTHTIGDSGYTTQFNCRREETQG